jgi:hypothetical protein
MPPPASPFVRLGRSALISAVAALAACAPSEGDVARVRAERDAALAQVAQLRATLDLALPRVERALALEFRGEEPAAAGAVSTVRVVSAPSLPDPATSDYPDCVAVFEVDVLAAPGREAGEALLAAMAFADRVPTFVCELAPGDLVDAVLLPWKAMPDDIRSVQRADETERFELPMFAALGLRPHVEVEAITAGRLESDGVRAEAAIERMARAVERRLAAYGVEGGDPFEVWRAGLDRDVWRVLEGLRGDERVLRDDRFCWRNRSYVVHPTDTWPEPQIAYFAALRDQLAARGIDLIVVPFPEMEQVSSLHFLEENGHELPADGVVDADRERWLLAASRAGIEVVDLRPALVAARDEFDRVYYDAEDGHPADGAIRTAARVVAERLRRYELEPTYDELRLVETWYAIPESQTKFPPHAYEPYAYAATVVQTPDGRPLPASDERSPILAMGDSFLGVPRGNYKVPGADLPAHLARETGILPRRLEVGGGAPQLMVHLARAGSETLEGVRVCLYVFRENYMYRQDTSTSKFNWQVVDLPE